MKRSCRYQKVKKKVINSYSSTLKEVLNFLRDNNRESSKTIKVSFNLNWAIQKKKASFRQKIILPYPLLSKNKLAIVKDNLPVDIAKNLIGGKEIELLPAEEARRKILTDTKDKIKKMSQWGFEKLIVHPQDKENLKLSEKLPPKQLGIISKKVLLTENILEAVNNFQQGEQEIKNDRGGNIHVLVGKSNLSAEQLTENYKFIYDKITNARPVSWKGKLFKNIVFSTAMGPGLKLKI